MATLGRLWPLLLIVALLIAVFASGLDHLLAWSVLAARQAELRAWVAASPVVAGLSYVGVYMAIVAVSIPGAIWLTLGGGLLFGSVVGTILAVIGAGSGAVLLFLAARSALAPLLAAKLAAAGQSPVMDRVRARLAAEGFSYLLALRLIPVVPFWLTNLAPALVGMRLAPYAAATFLGIIPPTAVFASIGAGLGSVIARGAQPDLTVIFRPNILLPLLGLALLSLAPIAWRRWRAGHA
jgi:uncharacterized membrane protein YdjX (TVP38/TMEM64 family)